MEDGPAIALRSFNLPHPGLPRTWVMDVHYREIVPVNPPRNEGASAQTSKTLVGFWDNMPLEEIRPVPPPFHDTYRRDKPVRVLPKSSVYEVGMMLFLTYLMILVAHVAMMVLANLNGTGR